MARKNNKGKMGFFKNLGITVLAGVPLMTGANKVQAQDIEFKRFLDHPAVQQQTNIDQDVGVYIEDGEVQSAFPANYIQNYKKEAMDLKDGNTYYANEVYRRDAASDDVNDFKKAGIFEGDIKLFNVKENGSIGDRQFSNVTRLDNKRNRNQEVYFMSSSKDSKDFADKSESGILKSESDSLFSRYYDRMGNPIGDKQTYFPYENTDELKNALNAIYGGNRTVKRNVQGQWQKNNQEDLMGYLKDKLGNGKEDSTTVNVYCPVPQDDRQTKEIEKNATASKGFDLNATGTKGTTSRMNATQGVAEHDSVIGLDGKEVPVKEFINGVESGKISLPDSWYNIKGIGGTLDLLVENGKIYDRSNTLNELKSQIGDGVDDVYGLAKVDVKASEQLNEILKSENPLEVVKNTYENSDEEFPKVTNFDRDEVTETGFVGPDGFSYHVEKDALDKGKGSLESIVDIGEDGRLELINKETDETVGVVTTPSDASDWIKGIYMGKSFLDGREIGLVRVINQEPTEISIDNQMKFLAQYSNMDHEMFNRYLFNAAFVHGIRNVINDYLTVDQNGEAYLAEDGVKALERFESRYFQGESHPITDYMLGEKSENEGFWKENFARVPSEKLEEAVGYGLSLLNPLGKAKEIYEGYSGFTPDPKESVYRGPESLSTEIGMTEKREFNGEIFPVKYGSFDAEGQYFSEQYDLRAKNITLPDILEDHFGGFKDYFKGLAYVPFKENED